ncbi:hypothetical protein AAG565_07535 [Fontimonas sp. SYSU GA230001]|uniref:hypothetical protein n=1 Tax=Fontimonas sp. SYSU GA230001 TaxID=3142450 RepID=UPI0032B3663A
MTTTKKTGKPAAKAESAAAPQKKGPTKGIFKQPLQKPQPWSFGGRGVRPQDEGAKAQPDAERLAGKSRKVH